jgi:hypothetical protein
MVRINKLRESLGRLDDLEQGEQIVGTFSIAADGALGICMERVFTKQITPFVASQIVAAVAAYLDQEMRKNKP